MTSSYRHQSVLADEVVRLLAPAPGKTIVDGTLGGGGHAAALLQKGARVIGLDQDPSAIAAATARLASVEGFTAIESNFADLSKVLSVRGIDRVDGILLDLGVSSWQLDSAERGFSFQKDGPLDMRMGKAGLPAADLIAQASEEELADWIFRYGEERFSRRIAKQLKAISPTTTLKAAAVVAGAVPKHAWPKGTHVATRTFQALRIAVNRELEVLSRFLSDLPGLLGPGGVAAIISFHSLEDRMVKQAFNALLGRCTCPKDLPICVCGKKGGGFRLLTKRPWVASDQEVAKNPRSRSARLRAVEKVGR